MRPPRARQSGQAAVEAALCLMVFVTILMIGIHFGEVGFMAIRVQEAAVSPLWDATSFRVDRMDMSNNPPMVADDTPFPSIAPTVGANAQGRYSDFDGRRSTSGATNLVRAAFTEVDQMRTGCYRDDTLFFDIPRGGGPTLLMPQPGGGGFGIGKPGSGQRGANASVLGRVYKNEGGIACRADARLTGIRIPQTFLEGGGGFFQAQHWKPLQMRLCAAGSPVGNRCPGQYNLLLGDWGWAGLNENGHCPIQPDMPDQPCPENPAFYNGARYVFEDNEGWAGRDASTFALTFAGIDPMPQQGFFMSYRGIEDGYVEPNTPPGEAAEQPYRPWDTGGVQARPPARRPGNCFLGRNNCP